MPAIVERPESDDFAEFARGERDGAGCLLHLLSSLTREGATFREMILRADRHGDSHIAKMDRRSLATQGVALAPSGAWAMVGVATAHAGLARVFCDTPYMGSWSTALLTLPGAQSGGRIMFGRGLSPFVALPRPLFGLEARP